MAAMIAAGIDFDYSGWTRPEDHVNPSTDLADLYEEGFAGYLSRLESARELWDRLPRPDAP